MSHFPVRTEWRFNGREELEQFLQHEDVDRSDICLVGSMSLSVRGIREHNDIDICVDPDDYDRLSSCQLPAGISIARNRYEPIGASDEEILYNKQYHDIVDEFKIVRPELTLSYKRYRNRPKDADDVELLEQYRKEVDEWDEELYKSLGSGSSASLISRGFESIRNDGVVVTGIKTAGFLERRYPTISTVRSYFPIREAKIALKWRSTNIEATSSATLLSEQYHRSEFCAMDVIFRYDVLFQHSVGNSDVISKYTAGNAIEKSDVERLIQLRNGDPESISKLPVRVNHRLRVLNPNEFAARLWHGLENHQLSVHLHRQEAKTVDWLSSNGISTATIERLQQRRLELLESSGVLFYAILWPPSFEYHDEIERTLTSNSGVEVVDSVDTMIHDMYSFVHAVYDAQADPTSDRQIDEKIELIGEFGNKVRILTLELPNPRIHDGISLEMEAIKNDVRHKFVPKLTENLYYSILHVTDNYSDNKLTKQVVEEYI